MKNVRQAKITAVGHYVPEKVLDNFDLEKLIETNNDWIISRTGIKERHIAAENETSSDMSVKAVQELLEQRKMDASEIDILIVATVTPDMLFPSTAALILDKLGVKTSWGFDLSGACSGFLYALSSGAAFIKAGTAKKVVVVGVDKMSSIMDYTDRNTCILFGDGAGAVLLEADDNGYGIFDEIMYTDGEGEKYLHMKGGGCLNPATHETVDAKMHYLKQDGKSVFKYAVKGMQEVSEEILEKNNLTGKDLSLFIPHQANLRIIDMVAKRIGLTPDQVLINIDKFANTTAATLPLGIWDALQDKRLKKDDILLLAAFGAGFTWGSTLIKWE
ncbi:MAG: ketoacyl-ACP synthase III [Candidatus Marinimicrobia bacterium]|nr:ketoacyl-ACP synthase III [Candidatus Neomarinimicrobiota bacterium]